ncbi:MAG: hypothetical protein IMY73_04550 [Bacteroidetes bacterium]|nr:hypothetical protein [Bacteroidota bacterium]
MVKLKLKASSLIEVIVSSIILLIVFVISMDTLMRLSITKNNIEDTVQMEMDIRECIKKEHFDEENIRYEWGEINILQKNIGNNLAHITYYIKMNHQQKKIDFEKIIIRKDKY